MKKQILIAGMIAGTIIAAPLSLRAAGPEHHHHHDGGSSGVRLAADIVDLVRTAVEPRTTVVVNPAPRPAAVVYQAPAVMEYRYYNGSYVVYESGWYWYGNNWIWGGRGAPPPKPPVWRPAPPRPNPPYQHYKHPAPPKPHHGRHGGPHHR